MGSTVKSFESVAIATMKRAMAMPQNFALLKTKITSPILFTLFRNKA
jgi:hypothetical protein